MTYRISDDDHSLPLPLTQQARRTALQFSRQQPTPQRADQVRLNTLAVAAVHDYLQLMGIVTDLTSSDSWNPVVRLCADVADLQVPGIGRLECRPLATTQPTCPIPPEVWEDRIGYVVVQIDETQASAELLGFVPQAAVEDLPLTQLRSPEALLDHLDQLRQSAIAPMTTLLTNLSDWFQQRIGEGWQTIESLLNPPQLAPAYRSSPTPNAESSTATEEPHIRRAKLIDLGIQLGRQPVALVVELQPGSNQSTQIWLQVHPTEGQTFLPPDLRLTVLDESGTVFLEAQSRTVDNYIQLHFSGRAGEQFRVRLSLGEISVTEQFMI